MWRCTEEDAAPLNYISFLRLSELSVSHCIYFFNGTPEGGGGHQPKFLFLTRTGQTIILLSRCLITLIHLHADPTILCIGCCCVTQISVTTLTQITLCLLKPMTNSFSPVLHKYLCLRLHQSTQVSRPVRGTAA